MNESQENKSKIQLCKKSFEKGLTVFGYVIWYGFYICMLMTIVNLVLFPFQLNLIHDLTFSVMVMIMSCFTMILLEVTQVYTPFRHINETFHIFGWKD